MNFVELCTRANEIAKEAGWWDDERNIGELIALMHSEVSECYEGILSGENDEHLPQYKNFMVEAADVCIRIADFVGGKNIQVELDNYIADMPKTIDPNKSMVIILETHAKLTEALEGLRTGDDLRVMSGFGKAFSFAYTLTTEEIVNAKMKYNVTRGDHKLENRVKEGGKKF